MVVQRRDGPRLVCAPECLVRRVSLEQAGCAVRVDRVSVVPPPRPPPPPQPGVSQSVSVVLVGLGDRVARVS